MYLGLIIVSVNQPLGPICVKEFLEKLLVSMFPHLSILCSFFFPSLFQWYLSHFGATLCLRMFVCDVLREGSVHRLHIVIQS